MCVIDDLRHVGATARAAERGPSPVAARHELERPRRDLLAGPGDADDDARAPALVATLERLTHHAHVADALEAVVRAAAGQLDEVRDEIAAHFLRVHEVGHPERLREGLPPRVDVHADDLARAGHARALHHVEPDAAEAEDDDRLARPHLRGVDDRADARRHAAADVADLVERSVGADLGERDLRQHGEARERRRPHVVKEPLAPGREAARPVGHEALALGRADRLAEVRLAARAVRALAALRRVERDDVVALLQRAHPGPDVDDDAGALVPQDGREEALGILARERVRVGVADPGRLDLHEDLPFLRALDVDRLDRQRLPCPSGHGGACFQLAYLLGPRVCLEPPWIST